MNNPDTDSGRRISCIPRSRWGRGWRRAACVGLAVLAGAFAGAGQAQDDYDNLDEAVNKLTRLLVLEGGRKGKEVFVSPRDFFEMGSERSLPLSNFLARKLIRALRRHGAIPVTATDDEHEAAILRGEWDIVSVSGNLHLFLEVKWLTDDGSLRTLASEEGRVPVASIGGRYLDPDLESHGRFIVRRLERDLPRSGRYRLYIPPFRIEGQKLPEGFGEELLDIWLSAFTGSSRFTLVGSPGQAEGELRVTVRDRDETVQVSLRLRSNQGGTTAAVTARLDKKDFPPGMVGDGPMPSPDILHRVAQAGDIEGLRAAIESGADVDARDDKGWTALMHAVEKGYPLLVRPLLEVDAAPDLRAPDGATALFMAVEGGHAEIVELLKKAGAAVSVKGPGGRTALEVAWERRNEAVLRALGIPQEGDVFRDCEECPELVVVREGSFLMGSPESEAGRDDDEGPRHRVAFARPFAVSKYEVTRGEFARFVSAEGRSMGDSCRTYEGGGWDWRSGKNWENPGFEQTDEHPVVCVSWDDAQAYVKWLSGKTGKKYRLPSESEWEYMARAGTGTARYWGEGEEGQCRYANGADEALKGQYADWKWAVASCNDRHVWTSPVGSFEANGFGLHDVLGNVWEWVEDCWNGSYEGAPVDGSAWESGDCERRVLRGGSWDDAPWNLRSANRNRHASGLRNYNAGFRVARTLTP